VSKPDIYYEINRTDEILRYVRKNPRCTKADVIRHMKGKSALTTTHALLTSLVNEGKINVYKVNVQTHLLSINEENKFNKLHKLLIDIQKLVDDMYPFMSLPYRRIHSAQNPKIEKLFLGLEGIENSYRQSFSLIIQILYNEARATAFPKDQPILFSILNSINLRFLLFRWNEKTTKEILGISSKNIEKCFKDYNKYVADKTDLGDKLIETIENFRKQFLS
jgi:hypothetical protein